MHIYTHSIDGYNTPEPVRNLNDLIKFNNSYTSLFCRQCYKYDCVLHRTSTLPIRNPLITISDSSGDSQKIDQLPKNIIEMLKRTCINENKCDCNKSNNSKKVMTGAQSIVLLLLRCVFDNCKIPCLYSLMMNQPCSVIRKHLFKITKHAHIKALKNTIPYSNNVTHSSADDSISGKNQLPPSYQPCHHPNHSCTQIRTSPTFYCCALRDNKCEKYCGCDLNCPFRFTGCKCKIPCNNEKCPCFAALRECDPDKCHTCENDEFFDNCCKNNSLQKKMHLPLRIGKSEISGWGVFVMRDVQCNELIAEYCGELLSQNDAEHRGRMYDKEGCSFLFNLNEDMAVDATIFANKIRFANHSLKPNCYAKVIFSNGDHRIGIFADKAISAGSELFFDYKYNASDNLRLVGLERKKSPIKTIEKHL